LKPPFWFRATRFVVVVTGWLVSLAVFGGLGVLIHVNLPAGRAVTAAVLDEFLTDFFQGSVDIQGLRALSSNGLSADVVSVYDVYGNRVLVLRGLRARASLRQIASKLLSNESKISLVINHVRVEAADAQIIVDPKSGVPTIGAAFTPTPTPEGPPSERYVRVWLPVIEIGRIFARGEVAKGAPTLETDLTKVRGSVLVTPKGTAVDVPGFGMHLRGLAGADARGLGRFHLRYPGAIWGFFDGYFGELQTSAFGNWDDGRLKVRLDVPELKPAHVRALWPVYPLERPAALHAEAEGPLDELQTKLNVRIGDAVLDASGPLAVTGDPGIELDVTGKSVDASAIFPTFPKTSIDLKTSLSIWPGPRQTQVEFNGYTEPGLVGTERVPAIDIRGTYDELGLVSRATLHEPGLATKVSFDRNPAGVISIEVDAKRFSLDHPRFRPYVTAHGTARGKAVARIENDQVTGSFGADVDNLRIEAVSLARAHVEGKLSGRIDALDDLKIQAYVSGQKFARDELRFEKFTATAAGPLSKPKVRVELTNPGGQALSASGNLKTRDGVAIDDLAVALANQGADLSVSVERIQTQGGSTKIDNLVFKQGEAELRGDIELLQRGIKLRLKGQHVDLERVAAALGVRSDSLRGRVSIDADVVSTEARQEGAVDVAFSDLHVLGVEPVSGRASIQFEEHHLSGQGELEVGGLGRMGANVGLTLGGRVDDIEAWKRATGSGHVEFYAIDLGYFNRYLTPDMPVQAISGLAQARLRVERSEPESVPRTMFDATTQGLEVLLAQSDPKADPEVIRGIDLQLGGAVDGPAGSASGSVRAVDRVGALLSASGKAHLDLARLWHDPSAAGELLPAAEFDAVAVVPTREIQKLPPEYRPAGVEGTIAARLSARGTPSEPLLSALVDLERLRGSATSLSLPISLKGRFNYAADTGGFGGSIEANRKNERIVWGHFKGTATPDQLFAEEVSGPRWTGAGTFSLEGVPLRLLQPLSRARVKGEVSGVVAVSRQADLPDVKADLEVTHGDIQGIPLGTGKLSARAEGENVSARLGFKGRTGQIDLSMRTRTHWLDDAAFGVEPILLDLESKSYDAVLLLPFVEDLVSDLSGPLDADVKAQLQKVPDEHAPGETRWDVAFSGKARLKNGVIRPAVLGMHLRDTNLSLVARREDDFSVVEIAEMSASVRSDEPNLTSRGKLYFKRAALSHGWFGAGLDRVPVVINGVRLADATGQVATSFRQDAERMSMRVSLPRLRVLLPRSAGRALIELPPNPDIQVVQELGLAEADTEERLPWVVKIDLGDDVRVSSATLNLRLTGNPTLTLADELSIDGKLVLPAGGRANVAGKVFIVETGFVQFDTDDFTNPHVNIRAVWRAPSGVIITASLAGTAREPELTLTSDPPLAGGEAEIYALLFGGGAGNTESSAADPALGAGATMLSEVLGNTALRGVELRAGIEQRSNNTSTQSAQLTSNEWRSYAAAVPLSDDVWFEGSYKQEERSTATEGHSGFSGTIDWRFKQDWALRTEAGQLGTGLDVLWYYRY